MAKSIQCNTVSSRNSEISLMAQFSLNKANDTAISHGSCEIIFDKNKIVQ